MSKLIKRKDGSYSKRGLWDNIRANKGSGKEPTKDMLKQETKIKKEENMNSMYRKGGKSSKKSVMNEAKREKESFLEESKEIGFGAPGVKPPKKKYAFGGPETTTKKNLLGQTVTTNKSGLDYDRTVTRKNGTVAKQSGVKTEAFNSETGTSDTDNFYKKKYDRSGNLKSSSNTVNKYMQEDKDENGNYTNAEPFSFSAKSKNGKITHLNGVRQKNIEKNRTTIDKFAMGGESPLKKTLPSDDSDARSTARVRNNYKGQPKKLVEKTYTTEKDAEGYPTGYSTVNKKVTKFPEMYNVDGSKEPTPVVTKNKTRRVSDSIKAGSQKTNLTLFGPSKKRTGGKSMAPGGGGRFEALVNKLKSKGKSADQAKGIAAAAGRAKYGKSKFQAMAAAGRKKG